MKRPAVLAPAARADLRQAVAWIARNNPVAAQSCRAAIGRAATLIGSRPEIGRVRPELASPRYRFWSLGGFPYLLVYDVSVTPPRVARVLHMARDLPPLLADLRH